MNLFDFLSASADRNRIAIIQDGKEFTYDDVLRLADNIAGQLIASGAAFQKPVGILAENSPFWVSSYLAIIKIGAVAAPLPSRLTSGELWHYIRTLNLSTLCVDDRLLPRYRDLVNEIEHLVLKSKTAPAAGGGENDLAGSEAVDEMHDLAALMFTSGSTGSPNAVKVTHRNIMANTNAIISYVGLSADDRMMVILPFHYCFGTSLLHTHLRMGASLVLNNYFQYVEDVLEEMEACACTGFAGVPSTYQSLLNNRSFRSRHFPSLRHMQQAGGRLADRYIRELRAILPPQVNLLVGYGQTEATARLSCLPPGMLDLKSGSIGKGISGVTLKIVDENGHLAPQGQVGEIVAEGDNVTPGYLLPDPAKDPFREGKLFTGDLAYADEDGYLYIVGRAKDFIKPNGYKVMTASIEQVLLELPEIAEAAVIGVPHDQLGEAAKAWVVLQEGADLPASLILEQCRAKLPAYAVPCSIEYSKALPKNMAGKIMKQALKQQEES